MQVSGVHSPYAPTRRERRRKRWPEAASQLLKRVSGVLGMLPPPHAAQGEGL